MSIVNAAAKAMVEGFVGTMSSEKRRDAYVDFLAVVIAFALSLVLLGFVGKYLWNNVVVDLLTIAKPVKSFWQIIGFMIFVSLIHS
jgi:hypothetical protein